MEIVFEVTTFCQADCKVCVRDKIRFPLGTMKFDIFQKSILDIVEYARKKREELTFIDLGGMGEPLLDNGLEEKLKWLKSEYPQIRVGLTTNGGLINEKLDLICNYIDVIKISNYGFSRESFRAVHRGSLEFENVKNGIETLTRVENGKKPKVIISFLRLEENIDEEVAWKNYWEDKVDELFIWKPHNWAGYGDSDTVREAKLCRSCGRPGHQFVIRATGEITACCWDFNRELVIGNIMTESFSDIIKGDKLHEIIEVHKKGKFFDSEYICKNCDQLWNRTDSLIYSSCSKYKVGKGTVNRLSDDE